MIELLLRLTPEERRALVHALEEAARKRIPAADLPAYLSGFIAGWAKACK